jgi:hypothetical protein
VSLLYSLSDVMAIFRFTCETWYSERLLYTEQIKFLLLTRKIVGFEHFIARHSLAFPLRTGFEDRPVHAKFVVNKATLGQGFLTVLGLPLSSFRPCFMLAHSSSPKLCNLSK